MIKIFALFLLLLITGVSEAATINAASCSVADIDTAENTASSGDTIAVPSGICHWSTQMVLTKNIILQGTGVGNTVIVDDTSATSAGALLKWTAVTGGTAHRLTGFEFQGGTRTSRNLNGLMWFVFTNASGTLLRIDHNKFGGGTLSNELVGNVLRPDCAVGVIDNNEFYTSGDQILEMRCPNWDGVGDYGDSSYGDVIDWGSSEAVYFENNTIDDLSNSDGGCVDGNQGFRLVARFNTWTVFGQGMAPKRTEIVPG